MSVKPLAPSAIQRLLMRHLGVQGGERVLVVENGDAAQDVFGGGTEGRAQQSLFLSRQIVGGDVADCQQGFQLRKHGFDARWIGIRRRLFGIGRKAADAVYQGLQFGGQDVGETHDRVLPCVMANRRLQRVGCRRHLHRPQVAGRTLERMGQMLHLLHVAGG